ncbi:MAG: hypothetical protein H6607_00375 [Flavobacteriales bacterium]|nr:hypothetical protein [Flavobacteriales bacterium]
MEAQAHQTLSNIYLIYLPVAVVLTLLVALIFFKNSKIFMLDIFNGRAEIADSTNALFKIGFYLLSLGFALFQMRTRIYESITKATMYEVLSDKIGTLSVFLGIMVFLNLYLLFRGKRKSRENQLRQRVRRVEE